MRTLESVEDRSRLNAVRRVLPIDRERCRVLERLVQLAAELVQAPMALLTILEDDRQIFVAQTGLPADLAAAGSTPIEMSICQYAVSKARPLVVGDARLDALLCEHPAVVELGVVAYAGIPLITGDQHAVGTLCAVDVVPRTWDDDQLARLAFLADVAMDEFQLQDHERAAAFRRMWKGVPETGRW